MVGEYIIFRDKPPYPRRIWLFVVVSRRIAWGKVNYVVFILEARQFPVRAGSRITKEQKDKPDPDGD